jgi:hypothetical protein
MGKLTKARLLQFRCYDITLMEPTTGHGWLWPVMGAGNGELGWRGIGVFPYHFFHLGSLGMCIIMDGCEAWIPVS